MDGSKINELRPCMQLEPPYHDMETIGTQTMVR